MAAGVATAGGEMKNPRWKTSNVPRATLLWCPRVNSQQVQQPGDRRAVALYPRVCGESPFITKWRTNVSIANLWQYGCIPARLILDFRFVRRALGPQEEPSPGRCRIRPTPLAMVSGVVGSSIVPSGVVMYHSSSGAASGARRGGQPCCCLGHRGVPDWCRRSGSSCFAVSFNQRWPARVATATMERSCGDAALKSMMAR